MPLIDPIPGAAPKKNRSPSLAKLSRCVSRAGSCGALAFAALLLTQPAKLAQAADQGSGAAPRPRQTAADSDQFNHSPTTRRLAAMDGPWGDEDSVDTANVGVSARENAAPRPSATYPVQRASYVDAPESEAAPVAVAANPERGDLILPPRVADPISPGKDSARLALAPPASDSQTPRAPQGMPSLATLLGGLGVVIGLFLLAAWLIRLGLPKGAAPLPSEAFEILGRAPLVGRQQVQLVRCGGKMLLLALTPGGAETLTEITDPAEVDRLAGICQQARPNSATASFRQLLDGFAREPQASRSRATGGGRDFELANLSSEDA